MISNVAGSGFGFAAAVGDFSADGNNDLILGTTRGEVLYDQYGAERGAGGHIFAIWGKNGKLGSVDVASIGNRGIIFKGQAEFTPEVSTPETDAATGEPEGNPASDYPLTDGIGDAAAMVDLDGDGLLDLAIGAPVALLQSPDGTYDLSNLLTGRVYVLFGSSDWTQETEYKLIDLYGDDYDRGIVLEGSQGRSLVGASLANVGFFRGDTDRDETTAGIEDLLIGAPAVNADAGQAFLVFGSSNRYTKNVKDAGENTFKLDPYEDPSSFDVALLFGYQGITNPVSITNPTNPGKVGHSVAGAGDINGDGSDDILIGGPTVSVNDLGQTYIPIGHTWIMPGQSLNVKDLRSDNGFVLEVPGPPAPVGDVNGDGYEDVVMLGEAPELVLGATALSNVNGVRQFELLPQDHDTYQVTWSTSDDNYTVVMNFSGVDLDGDGMLRGRVSPASMNAGNYGNELTDWLMQVYQGSELKGSIDWQQQQQYTLFNFNFDLNSHEVVAEDEFLNVQGINVGLLSGSTNYHLFSHISQIIQLNKGQSTLLGSTPFGSEYFQFSGPPVVPALQQKMYYAEWKGTGSSGTWTVELYFIGSDRNGDGYIQGRGNNSSIDQITNELAEYTMVVKQNDATKKTYTVTDLLNRESSNFNFWIESQEVRASNQYSDPEQGLNLGLTEKGDYNFYTSAGKEELVLKWRNNGSSWDRIADTDWADDLFLIRSGPLLTNGPLVSGDFNADAENDFILFTNLGTLHPVAMTGSNGTESRRAFLYYGNANAQTAVAEVDTLEVPLTYISGAASGDINGDGYHDVVISGYNYNISGVATSTDKAYVLAYYGSKEPLDLSAPDKILYAESANVSRHVLAMLDISNNGQDDVVTYTLERADADTPPFPYMRTGVSSKALNKIEALYTYGAEHVGGTAAWHGPIGLMESVFSDGVVNNLDFVLDLAAARQVDVDNDGLVDLIFSVKSSDGIGGMQTFNYILNSTGAFTFEDGDGKWKTTRILYEFLERGKQNKIYYYLVNPQAAIFQNRITGIQDFNLDGIDDIMVMADNPTTLLGKAVYSYIIYGSTGLPGSTIELKNDDDKFQDGMGIRGLQWLQEPYAASDAGDLNGDGYGDIMMSNETNALSYGIYGYRIHDSQTVDYIKGTEEDDILQQSPTTATLVNVSGQSGDDFIQTMRTVEGSTQPYKLVLRGGPGDDKIGISSVNGAVITRIDGGPGFDELFINPYYSGGTQTLDLTIVGRRISNIELIDLGDTNGIEFSFLEVRNLTEWSNTLLLRGTNARAKPVDGNDWEFLGQSTHEGIIYNVYEYLPEGNPNNSGKSNIQVWIEQGGVSWLPLD